MSGPTASVARQQNWNCQRIARAIDTLVQTMQSAKARAEREEERMPQTIVRAYERIVGPRGAGNAALIEFHEARSDAGQLSALLGEKGCARHKINVQAPAFLQ